MLFLPQFECLYASLSSLKFNCLLIVDFSSVSGQFHSVKYQIADQGSTKGAFAEIGLKLFQLGTNLYIYFFMNFEAQIQELFSMIDHPASTQEIREQNPQSRRNQRELQNLTTILESKSEEIQEFPDLQIKSTLDSEEEKLNSEQNIADTREKIKIPSHLIFKKKKFKYQNKNTPRFMIRLALKYMKEFQSQYPAYLFKILSRECKKLLDWHTSGKKNVFLINHLKFLLTKNKIFTKKCASINRKVFRQILKVYSNSEMDEPRCQIGKHKIDYMRACKVFSLRCMNGNLVERNQTK